MKPIFLKENRPKLEPASISIVNSFSKEKNFLSLSFGNAKLTKYEITKDFGPVFGPSIAYNDVLSDNAASPTYISIVTPSVYSMLEASLETFDDIRKKQILSEFAIFPIEINFGIEAAKEINENNYSGIKLDSFSSSFDKLTNSQIGKILRHGANLENPVMDPGYLPPFIISKDIIFENFLIDLKWEKNKSGDKPASGSISFEYAEGKSTSIFDLIGTIKNNRVKLYLFILLLFFVKKSKNFDKSKVNHFSLSSSFNKKVSSQRVERNRKINLNESEFSSFESFLYEYWNGDSSKKYFKDSNEKLLGKNAHILNEDERYVFNLINDKKNFFNVIKDSYVQSYRNGKSDKISYVDFANQVTRQVSAYSITKRSYDVSYKPLSINFSPVKLDKTVTNDNVVYYHYDPEKYVTYEEEAPDITFVPSNPIEGPDPNGIRLKKIYNDPPSDRVIYYNNDVLKALYNFFENSELVKVDIDERVVNFEESIDYPSINEFAIIGSKFSQYIGKIYFASFTEDNFKANFQKFGFYQDEYTNDLTYINTLKVSGDEQVWDELKEEFLRLDEMFENLNIIYDGKTLLSSQDICSFIDNPLYRKINSEIFQLSDDYGVKKIENNLITYLRGTLKFSDFKTHFGYEVGYSKYFTSLVNNSFAQEIKDRTSNKTFSKRNRYVKRTFVDPTIFNSKGGDSYIYDFDPEKWPLKISDVNFDDEDAMLFIDDMIDDQNLLDFTISFLNDDISIDDPYVIRNIQKLMNFENLSDEQVDYITSAQFVEDWTVDGRIIMDVDGFVDAIQERVEKVNGLAIDFFSQLISNVIGELSKMDSSYNTLLNVDSTNAAKKMEEIGQLTDLYSNINNNIDSMLNDLDTQSVDSLAAKRIHSKLKLFVVKFDIGLKDPFLTLMSWKENVIKRMRLFAYTNRVSQSMRKFNDIINKISLPTIDLSNIGEVLKTIFSRAMKFTGEVLKRSLKALSIFENLANIIETLRYPFKVISPKIGRRMRISGNNEYVCCLTVPPGYIVNPNVLKESRFSFMNSFRGDFENDKYKLKFGKMFIPEINSFNYCIFVTLNDDNIEEFKAFADEIVNDDSLSELSKFFSIVYGAKKLVDPEFTAEESGIISGITLAQAGVAAGSALVSGGASLVSRLVGSAIAFSIVGAANLASFGEYMASRTANLSSLLERIDDDNDFKAGYVENEVVLINSISNISTVPLTPAFVAGKVMLQVAAIAGGFGAAVVVGALIGQLSSAVRNKFTLYKKKRGYILKQKEVTDRMNAELAKIEATGSDIAREEYENGKENFDELSDVDKKKITKQLVKEKQKLVKLKYQNEDDGIAFMNKAQITGLAKYNLFLKNNGFGTRLIKNINGKVSVPLASKAISAIPSIAGIGVSAAAGVLSLGTGLLNLTKQGVKISSKKIKQITEEGFDAVIDEAQEDTDFLDGIY